MADVKYRLGIGGPGIGNADKNNITSKGPVTKRAPFTADKDGDYVADKNEFPGGILSPFTADNTIAYFADSTND